MSRLLTLAVVLVVVVVLGGTALAIFQPALQRAAEPVDAAEDAEHRPMPAAEADAATMARTASADAVAIAEQARPGADDAPTRQIIQTVDLEMRVADPRVEAADIEAWIGTQDGFVESSHIRETFREGQYTADVRLRLPADRLDDALAALRDRADRVLREQRQAQDVTDQHADLEARLRNQRHAEEQLLALMTEVRERSNDLRPLMQAYRELANVREQIERLEGQIDRLEDRVAMATVTVRLLGPDDPASIADPEWSLANIASHAGWALVRSLQVLATVVIYSLVAALPLVLVIAAPIAAIALAVRRWRRSSA